MVGYLTKFVPAIAAKIAIFSGVVLYSISQFVLKPMVIESGASYPHFLHVMAILFVLNVCIMLLIGKWKPAKVGFELVYTDKVNIDPWKNIYLASALVTVIVLFIYVYFA